MSKHHKANDAIAKSAKWLADGNRANESGDKEKAERCYEKSQRWLDRYNRLTNQN